MAKKSVSILDQICTAEEAGAIIGVTKERVNQMRKEPGSVLEARQIGRDWLYTLDSVRRQAEIPRYFGPKKNREKSQK